MLNCRRALRCGQCLHAGILLICIVLAVTSPLEAQSAQKNSKASTPSTAVLAQPVDWNPDTHRLFQDDPQQLTFRLQTSWIPGENRRGMLRYKLATVPMVSAESSQNAGSGDREAAEKFLNRVLRCSIFLEFYDHGGFVLRKHEVPFAKGVDDEARLRNLVANDSLQMDAEEYRLLISEKVGGAWGIGWNCYEKIP